MPPPLVVEIEIRIWYRVSRKTDQATENVACFRVSGGSWRKTMPDARKNDDREVFTPEELPEDLLDELEAKIEEARSLGVVETDFEIAHF
jgi:hypothetical protein